MDPLWSVISQLGLGLATNAVYDYLRQRITNGSAVDTQTLECEIRNAITASGVTVTASTVINALVENGFLTIEQSNLHAPNGMLFGSANGNAVVGNQSKLSTDKTAIIAGEGAFLKTEGNAQVRQNPDGSIDFLTGVGSISFLTTRAK